MSKRDVLTYARQLVQAGVLERPLWMSAVERTPPLPVGKPGRRPPPIKFPEDELVEAYYRKHPEARLEPLDLSSFEPPTARRFALRQLHLIEKGGLTKRAAFCQVEHEFATQREREEAAAGGARQSVIDTIQAEEELHIQQALRQYASSFGPSVVKQHAREMWQQQQGKMRPPIHPSRVQARQQPKEQPPKAK